MNEDEYRKDVESKIEELEGVEQTEVTEVLEVQAEESGATPVAETAADAKPIPSEPASKTKAPAAAESGKQKPPPSRKKVNAAFVLGIVGTSLAVLALIVGIAGFSHGRGDFDPRGPRTSITEEMDVQTDRSGRGGMHRDERVIERFEESDGPRGERLRERRHVPDRDLLEDQELLEEMMEENSTQDS